VKEDTITYRTDQFKTGENADQHKLRKRPHNPTNYQTFSLYLK
jgi:hypothetical protein